MALGALPASVQRMVLGQGMRPVLAGLAFGLAGAIVLTRLWASLLYEVVAHGSADVLRGGVPARRGRGGCRASSRRGGRRRWIRWWR